MLNTLYDTVNYVNEIGLLGATGYTGKLVAKELLAQDIPFKIGLRDEAKFTDKLDSESLNKLKSNPDKYRISRVDVLDEKSVANFYSDINTVISTVGPFCKLGQIPVKVAASTGINYVDSTGEPEFMKWVYENFKAAEGFIVPACGFDYLPGDVLSNLSLNDFKSSKNVSVQITYSISHWIPTKGTAESALMAFTNSADPGGVDETLFLDKKLTRLKIPWGEEVTVKLHHPDVQVSCYINLNKIISEIFKYTTPIFRLSIPIVEKAARLLPEGPSVEKRKKAKYDIFIKVTDQKKSVYSVFNGVDIYGTTAVMLILSALNATGKGAMAPSQAFEPDDILKKLTEFRPKSADLIGASCLYNVVKD